MFATYDPGLLFLSFLVACLSACTALVLGKRIQTDDAAPMFWLFAAASSMGVGVWATHFIGVLASDLGGPHLYAWEGVAASVAVGVLASGFSFHVGSRPTASSQALVVSGLIMGLGISVMHYIGVAAMVLPAPVTHDPALVGLSVAIIVVASTAALGMTFSGKDMDAMLLSRQRTVAALLMGVGVCGMQLAAMNASSFDLVQSELARTDGALSEAMMGVLLAVGAIAVLGLTQLNPFYDRRLAEQQKSIKRANQTASQLNEILNDTTNEIYVLETETYRFLRVNSRALENTGFSEEELLQMTAVDMQPEIDEAVFRKETDRLLDGTSKVSIFNTLLKRADGSRYPVNVSLQLSRSQDEPMFIAVVVDTTERTRMERQISQSRKMESIGQLAAGIAHEINTPAQFVSDNTKFLEDAFAEVYGFVQAIKKQSSNAPVSFEAIADLEQDLDLEYFVEEIPVAIEQSMDGISRISKIVLAMKEFSHPGGQDKELADLNACINNAVVVASNEWKYVAEVNMQLDETLPMVPCHSAEIGQVILNLVINAAHSIEERIAREPEIDDPKHLIEIVTTQVGKFVEISLRDTGAGIPKDIREKIFDPFFTTKGVGKGTGQGLAMAHATIVDQHRGRLFIDPSYKEGAKFVLHLPLSDDTSEGKKAESQGVDAAAEILESTVS